MFQKPFHRPSAALIVSMLALMVAMGGTAFAAVKLPKNSVGSAQIKKDAVRSSDVKSGSLQRNDFKGNLLPSMVVAGTSATPVNITAVLNDPVNTGVRFLTVPAGNYHVQAIVSAVNTSGSLQAGLRCYLSGHVAVTDTHGGTTEIYQPIEPDSGTNTDSAQVSLDAVFAILQPTAVGVSCNKESASQSVEVNASLSALRIGHFDRQ